MKIIAFDLGANMAWADGTVTGSWEYGGYRPLRLAAILNDLQKGFNWKVYNAVVYERPLARGPDATRSLWGIAGILEAVVTNKGVPIFDFAVPTIKKFATGHGFASKLDMITAAKKKFGYQGDNEHEADAVCLYNYAQLNLEQLVL